MTGMSFEDSLFRIIFSSDLFNETSKLKCVYFYVIADTIG